MLHFFDAHVRAEGLRREVVEHLAYFNIDHLLVAAHAPRPFDTADDLLDYFSDLTTNERHRLERWGLSPRFALGVHPSAVPRRTHFELWRELPSQLVDPLVVGVGELALESEGDPHEERLLARQLAMASEQGLAALVSPGRRERARRVRRIVDVVEDVGIDPDRVLVTQLDFTSLRIVLDAGCWAGVTVNPFFLSCEEASELIYRFGDAACDRVIVNSRLQDGVKDVLALPKLALLLAEQGFTPSNIRRLVWTNACRLFERQGDGTS